MKFPSGPHVGGMSLLGRLVGPERLHFTIDADASHTSQHCRRSVSCYGDFMPETLQSSTELLIGQWDGAPKLRALVQVTKDLLDEDVLPALKVLRLMRLIGSAEGVHLDNLGRRLGVGRPSTTDPAQDDRWGFDLDGTGFNQAPFRGDAANDAVFPLPDAIYRNFLRARVFALISDGTIVAFTRAVHAIDTGASVQDQRSMTIRIVTALRSQIELADQIGCLARNAGIGLIFADRGRFGFRPSRRRLRRWSI